MKIQLTMNTVAQGLHVTLGALCVAFPGWLWGNRAAVVGAGSALVFAAIKEGWFDSTFEAPATAGNGWEDFGFWALGIAAALCLGFV
jgi:hypothetical protein